MEKPGSQRTVLYLVGVFVFLYLEAFILPRTPLLAYGDQSVYLLNATRMLQGQVIYRDFFEFTPPGTESVYTALFHGFGVRAWIPQAMLVFLGVALTWLSVYVSKSLMKGPVVFLPGLLFVTLVFRNALDASHHWYAVLAAIGALAVLIEARSLRRVAFAGVLCGLATWFTQIHGLACLLGFGLFLCWENRRTARPRRSLVKTEVSLLGGFLAGIVLLDAPFAFRAGLSRFLFCTLVFPLKYYSAGRYNTWRAYMAELPPIHSWLDLVRAGPFLFVYLAVPLVYLLFLVRYWGTSTAQPGEPWERLMLVNIAGLFLFASVAAAPSYLRMCVVSLPALIVLVWLVSRSGRPERLILSGLWLVALTLAVAEPIARQRHWRGYLDLPTGRTAFLDPVPYEKYRWISERTHSSEPLFGDQLVSFALGLRDPAEIAFITPDDYTRPEQVTNLIQALERERVRYVLWYPDLDSPPSAAGDHLEPLRAYLRGRYHIARVFADGDRIWDRN